MTKEIEAKRDKEALKKAEAGFIRDLGLDIRKTFSLAFTHNNLMSCQRALAIDLMRIYHADKLTEDETLQMVEVVARDQETEMGKMCKPNFKLPRGRVATRLTVSLSELGYSSSTTESYVTLTAPEQLPA